MDWKLFASTFGAIFIAEMGDKTQIATMALAGTGSSRWVVFAGAALALIATSVIAVLLGAVVNRYVPEIWIRRAAGATFLVMGVLFLLSKAEPPTSEPDVTDVVSQTSH
jgi:putative Ca2+/H+ antiporter (TMEM165/GDT1 family)